MILHAYEVSCRVRAEVPGLLALIGELRLHPKALPTDEAP
jgi:hypothetical protein